MQFLFLLGHICRRLVLQEMLQAGLIVAGWDREEGGSVYAVPLGGTLVKCPFAIGNVLYKVSHNLAAIVCDRMTA